LPEKKLQKNSWVCGVPTLLVKNLCSAVRIVRLVKYVVAIVVLLL